MVLLFRGKSRDQEHDEEAGVYAAAADVLPDIAASISAAPDVGNFSPGKNYIPETEPLTQETTDYPLAVLTPTYHQAADREELNSYNKSLQGQPASTPWNDLVKHFGWLMDNRYPRNQGGSQVPKWKSQLSNCDLMFLKMVATANTENVPATDKQEVELRVQHAKETMKSRLKRLVGGGAPDRHCLEAHQRSMAEGGVETMYLVINYLQTGRPEILRVSASDGEFGKTLFLWVARRWVGRLL